MLDYLNRNLKYRFLLRVVPLLLLLGILGYQAFLYIVSDVTGILSQNIAEKQVLYDRARIMAPILRDISLVRHLADSSALIEWAMNENDAGLKHDAIRQLENYRTLFGGGNYAFMIDQSGHYYFNNRDNAFAGKQLRYKLSPDMPKDAWYYATRQSSKQCQVNVNNDPEINVTNVWVNCQVRHGKKNVGILSTGVDLTAFIHTVVNAHLPGIINLAINQDGAIQASPNPENIDYASLTHKVATKNSVFSLFDDAKDRSRFIEMLSQIKDNPEAIATTFVTLNGRRTLIGIANMKEIGWFNITVMDMEMLGLAKYFMPFAILFGLAMILLLALMGMLLNRMILSRIRHLDRNVQLMRAGDDVLSMDDSAPDEIGRLHETFVDMVNRVRKYSQGLELLVDKRTSELKRATLKAQSKGEQLCAIIECAMDGIIHIDRHGIIQSFNPEAEKMFGYDHEEVIGCNISMLMPEPQRSEHDKYIQRYLETKEPHIIGSEREMMALRKDGSTFPLSLLVNTMFIKGEVAFLGIVRDITDRRQAEEMVRKLSSAITYAGESVIITDSNGIIEYTNPAFTEVTGYSAEEAIGQTPRLLKSGNQDEAFYADMWNTITGGKVWHGKVIDRRKDGSFYPAMLTISPIFDAAENATHYTHFIGIQSDLSQLADMEQQFHQAQKMEAVGTMVGGIAHNFNNMLAGMSGNLYLAKQKVQAQPDVVQNLANVEELSHHAAEMIQQLLAFARKGVVSIKEMPLTPFICETLKLLRASVPEDIAVHQDMCADDLQISGDGTQLHQVLANLVNNARDAVEGIDKPCITIRLKSFQTDNAFIEHHPYFKYGAYAHLSVADNGMGIPEHHLEHLFEPFFTTKEQGKGTGLGLAMVYGAIKTHHGFVEIDSKKGKGSTFHLYIPLLKPNEMAAKPVQKQDSAEGRGELILLADDEQVVREVMAEILESLGYRVLQAKDGVEAFDLFKAHQQEIALALLDIIMPNLGGAQLALQIRALKPELPVIFLTGYDKEHVLSGDEKIQHSETFTKPVNFDELSHSIRQLLD